MVAPSEPHSRVVICHGARAAERRLFEEIDARAGASVDDLSRPLRVVVPSRSLRHHVLRALTRRCGAVAGIQIQTLFGFALETIARKGQVPPRADAGFEIQVRRLAAEQPALRGSLDDLSDGYDAVVGAVRDLLDAGFLPGNEDGVLERLQDIAGEVARERLQRSAALVRLASAAFEGAEESDLRRSMRALQLAEDALLEAGPDAAPASGLLVHGFADVTGVAADLLVAMVRVVGGTVILDRPPDPAVPGREDLGGAYLTRLEERLAHFEHVDDDRMEPASALELAEAPEAEAEARWVAESTRGLLDRGAMPEDIGVVGRGLDAMALPLRRHFRRLGVPFSGAGATVPGAGPRRRLRRLTELLRRGGSARADLWIEARSGREGATDLLLGIRVLGILRLADLAALPDAAVPSNGVRLPIAIGSDDEIEDDGPDRRRLPKATVQSAMAEATRLVDVLDRRPATAPPDDHRRSTLAVLDTLGWDGETPELEVVRRALDGLCSELPASFALSQAEWLKLVGDRLDGAGEVPLGGDGAGVQVLTVMESRARTFQYLFVIGLNRGVFPRVRREDSMLPEAVRARLAADVLPEMPVKGRGADEERYLFAQLLSSAPEVALSWHVYGADGTVTPSPFVDRMRVRDDVSEPVPVAQLWSGGGGDTRSRTAYELAVSAAPTAGPRSIGPILEAAVGEGRADLGVDQSSVPPETVAAARLEILAAVERSPQSDGPGPWTGFTGAETAAVESKMWVTHVEAIGTCPWRAFVQQRLGVRPMPDPLLGLPGIDGPLVGQVVHGVLEAIVIEALDRGGEISGVLARKPVAVRWPSRERLDELLDREARRVAAREGLAPIGMAPLLAERARQFLEVERELEWASGSLPGVLGCEVEGCAKVPGVAEELWFRADRVDGPREAAVLVDYKAAKPAVEAATEPHRSDNIRARIARGRMLQAAAYSRGEGLGAGVGTYLYLKPIEDCKEEIRHLAVAGDDAGLIEPFERAIRTISVARSEGVAFPRVEEADGSSSEHCRFCAVAEACRRDDSAFRSSLVRWMDGDDGAGDPSVDAARALWRLGFEPAEDEE